MTEADKPELPERIWVDIIWNTSHRRFAVVGGPKKSETFTIPYSRVPSPSISTAENKTLSGATMDEVRYYNDGNGCTRRELVDNLLLIIQEYTSVPSPSATQKIPSDFVSAKGEIIDWNSATQDSEEEIARGIVNGCLCAEPGYTCEESTPLHYNDLVRLVAAALREQKEK